MKKSLWGLAVLTVALSAVAARADRVKSGGKTLTGKVVEMTATEITIESGADRKRIPVNEIDSVTFDDEPKELNNARNHYNQGKYEDAQKDLAKADMKDVKRAEVKQEYDYYAGMCAVRLAMLGGKNKKDLEAAGKQLLAFIKNTGNYHYFEACETVGDILAALGLPSSEKYYGMVAAAPWPDYRMRATVLSGRALTAQKKYTDAIAKFDEVIAQQTVQGKEADKQRLSATLGKATAMTGMGNVEDAIKLLNEVIDKADPENKELHARAYNARGNCYVKAAEQKSEAVGGRTPIENKKHALTDFLHVDLLYSGYPEQHAEALANLAELWKEVNKGRRAEEARSELLKLYPDSAWAKWAPPKTK